MSVGDDYHNRVKPTTKVVKVAEFSGVSKAPERLLRTWDRPILFEAALVKTAMFQNIVDTFGNLCRSIGLREVPLEKGRVVDTLTRETFPALPEIGASLEMDISTIRMAIAMGPGNPPLPPTWYLKIRRPDGTTQSYSMSEEVRQRVLLDFRRQVAEYGRVTEVPLPRLSDWAKSGPP